MKALVATGATQGTRPSDLNDCVEGELVWLLRPCPQSVRDPAGRCPCGRSFAGLSSHGYTTTALVRDIPWLTPANYAAALRASFDTQGWCPCCTARPVAQQVDDLLALARPWPAGTVIERHLDHMHSRAG